MHMAAFKIPVSANPHLMKVILFFKGWVLRKILKNTEYDLLNIFP